MYRTESRGGLTVLLLLLLLLDLDLFNMTNSSVVLGKQYDLRRTGATGFDKILEVMNPRILRVGARLNF